MSDFSSSQPVSPSYALSAQESQQASGDALDQLLDEYRALSDSQRHKGNLFESLIKQYLLHDGQMRRQYKQVYLWHEWPGRDGRGDTGIDLVAIRVGAHGDEVVAVQCKFFEPGHTIQKNDIDSFLAESGKAPFVGRIFVETSGVQWGKNAEETLRGQQIPVTRIGLTDLRNSDVDWRSFSLQRPQAAVAVRERKTPRDHQSRAIKDVFDGFETSDRGTLVMACGTGKTFTALKIAEKTAEEKGGDARILFMVPSLALMSQTLQEWSQECALDLTSWSVCSDAKVNRKQAGADLMDLSVADVKVPPTTDPRRLADSLMAAQKQTGLQVVFSTYQSIDVVHAAQELVGDNWIDFDLIICDEAHRTTGVTIAEQDESAFTRVHNAQYLRADRRLYMTATPRIFREQTKQAAADSEADVVLTSMDDESIYGPVFHRLGFGEAVSQGLLTDYKVIVLAVSEDEVTAAYQGLASGGVELPLSDTAKLVGCWNALAKRFQGAESTVVGEERAPGSGSHDQSGGISDCVSSASSLPMKRAVAFCKDIRTSKQVAETFPALVRESLQDLTNDDPSDNLAVEAEHVDGSMNAVVRGERLDWLKANASVEDVPVCRILTNARCLSEGVDVPTLDAVLFLNPRRSQVDVIQAVGRVMRKAPGKELGYIVLPVAIPAGLEPEQALSDNSRYQVIWQVLQAIRAHDERFEATVNSIELNDARPENIVVEVARLPQRSVSTDQDLAQSHDSFELSTDTSVKCDAPGEIETHHEVQLAFNLAAAEQWKDAVYARIVKKVGSRLYWADWSKDIADIAGRYISLIDSLLEDPLHQDDFAQFVKALQETLNPSVDAEQAVEMLAQHLITKPLFDAMFKDHAFTQSNPVSRAMQAILDRLATNRVFELERQPLEKFYVAMVQRIEAVQTLTGKQAIMVTLFERFFKTAFPRMAERLGIVFTPTEVVDYIIRSANDALQVAFGKSLGDEGVSIIEPFAGTGTFIARLLQSGIIPPERLREKYEREIFANEIVLLSYYIASINIEQVFDQLQREHAKGTGQNVEELDYVPFEGMTLTDTFQMHEDDGNLQNEWEGLAANNERAQRQKKADLRVVIMNPPYSAGQKSANDNNQNLAYPRLDRRIADTYAALSTGTLKNSLYDSYFRALRWATDRIGDDGIIALVSNSSFIDGNTADGVRLTWGKEFSDIFVVNLKGNQRTQGERSRQEGGKIFGSGSRTGVAITILVKDRRHHGAATVHYSEVDDYLTRSEKLAWLAERVSIAGTDFTQIDPNELGDWINQRDENYLTYQIIGDKESKGKASTPGMFLTYSGGLKTQRDAWCYSSNSEQLSSQIDRHIEYLRQEAMRIRTCCATLPTLAEVRALLNYDSTRGSIDRFNENAIRHGRHAQRNGEIILGVYRPFYKQFTYFDPSRTLNAEPGQLPRLFPSSQHRNIALGALGIGSLKPFSLLMTDALPDLEMVSKAQWCSLYTWEPLPSSAADDLFAALNDEGDASPIGADTTTTAFGSVGGHQRLDFSHPIGQQIPTILGGYQRKDNITDGTLDAYRQHYGDTQITKEDIFFYTYALLHHPTYRERYAADLKKMLPRIPKAADFWAYAIAGRDLADLHVNYECVEPYPVEERWAAGSDDLDDWARYRVSKPAWAKRAKTADHSALVYNQYLTLNGIPCEAEGYMIGGRSPLGWVIDRYQLRTHKESGIVNDPNDYCREVGRPDYIVDLIKRLVTVSLGTQEIIAALPEFIVEE